MIDFKQITVNIKTEELYKQFNNAINNGHIYLKIDEFPYTNQNNIFYFKISKKGEDIEVIYATYRESDYFRTNLFDSYTALSFVKDTEKKTTKKTKNNPIIKYSANTRFYGDLNNSLNIIKFLTAEEYKIEELENTLDELKKKIETLEDKVDDLDRKKSNKFFV